MAQRIAKASRFRLYGIFAGFVGAFFGGAVGAAVGQRLGYGFRFDWYRWSGAETFAIEEVLVPVAILSAALGLLLSILGSYVAFRLWDARLRSLAAPPEAPRARTRDAHAFFTMLGSGIGLGLGFPLLASAILFGLDVRHLSPVGVRDVLAVSGAIAGFFATYYSIASSGDALAAGKVVQRPGVNLFGSISVAASRHAKPVVAAVLVLTLVAGYGVTLISTNVDVADVLPRGNPNTDAAHNLTAKFKSSFTLQTTFQVRITDNETFRAEEKRLLPYRGREGDAGNISDELYVRTIAEMSDFVLGLHETQGSPFVGTVGLAEFYRTINWTIAGGINADPATYALPTATNPYWAQHYKVVDEGVWAAIPATADAVISPSFRQTAVLFVVDPKEEMSSKEIGVWALRVRDAYVQWAEETPEASKVFTGKNKPIFSVDLPIANAHSSELTAKDFRLLLPIIAVFILISLFVMFRNWVSIVAAFTMLAIAVVWTFGAMGAMRMTLNTLNLTTVPLIMGVGIDYGIHMMNEYQEMRSKGKSMEEAWRHAGGGSAFALFVATCTTVSGLLVMVVSPSLLIAQLGILSAIAIVSCYVLSTIFIPAAVTVLGGGSHGSGREVEYKPSLIMPRLATAISRGRVFAILAILLLAVAAYASGVTIGREPFGDPPRNWLPDDPLRQEHERALQGFYDSPTDDVKANIFIFEGDITEPAAHDYMRAIEASLKEKPRVIADTLRTLPFLVETYLTVRDGAPGAALFKGMTPLGQRDERASPYPRTQPEIRKILDEVHTTPLSGLANLFYDHPDDTMAMMTFSVKAGTYEDAEEVWHQVQAALAENEALRPPGMRVSFFGNTAINYLFVAEEVPWLGYMSAATVLLVFCIVFLATRNLKLTLVVAIANFLTSLLWIGVLPQIGIGLAITLTLPLIFIFCMGSDYTLHLAMRCYRSKDTQGTFATVGKGVFFSFLTTFGAFAIFTQISNLAVRKTMVGTTVAIAVVMITTLLLVPIFYPVRAGKPPRGSAREPRSVPVAPQAPPSATRRKVVIVEVPPARPEKTGAE